MGESPSRLVGLLARKRVPLGFVAAVATVLLAQPTWGSWRAGLLVALIGEGLRIWAAGHLEKGREVTQSGPYRWSAHPLYVGSSMIAAGAVVASRSLPVAVLVAIYMSATITAAVRSEEAFLRTKFAGAYEDYRHSGGRESTRPFSLERAMRNREYRAVIGLVIGFGFLALRVLKPI